MGNGKVGDCIKFSCTETKRKRNDDDFGHFLTLSSLISFQYSTFLQILSLSLSLSLSLCVLGFLGFVRERFKKNGTERFFLVMTRVQLFPLNRPSEYPFCLDEIYYVVRNILPLGPHFLSFLFSLLAPFTLFILQKNPCIILLLH